MKSNKEMSDIEFNYAYACKRMMNDLYIIENDLKAAKLIGIKGVSAGALTTVEARLYDLQAAILNALKTV